MKEELIQIVAEYLGQEPSEIKTDMSFKDMGLDSLDILDVVMQIEEKFDLKLELSQEINTIDALLTYMEGLKK
jgi:acyl carrier protein